jgi:uncharacterized membrane protein
MKVFGHPIHLMLVHFPAALLPMDFICSCIAYLTGNEIFAHSAFFAAVGGVTLGILAILSGALDTLGIIKNHKNAVVPALIHGSINLFVVLIYGVLAYKVWLTYPEIKFDTQGILIFKGIIILLLLVGNYFGGNLIVKNKVLIEEK